MSSINHCSANDVAVRTDLSVHFKNFLNRISGIQCHLAQAFVIENNLLHRDLVMTEFQALYYRFVCNSVY